MSLLRLLSHVEIVAGVAAETKNIAGAPWRYWAEQVHPVSTKSMRMKSSLQFHKEPHEFTSELFQDDGDGDGGG